MPDPAPHSQEYFTESRDHWWNLDYVALLARRLSLAGCERVLEIGAGVGHWTAIIKAHVAAEAAITVTDREPQWVERLQQRFGRTPRLSVTRADVTSLPFDNGAFDLVTCQTLLLHVGDIETALREMGRVLCHGGRVLLSEPNNLMNRLSFSSSLLELAPHQVGGLHAFWFAYSVGRAKLGLGAEHIADLLPGLLTAAGFSDVTVFQNDRTQPLFPPFAQPEQRALIADLAQWNKEQQSDAGKEAVRKCVLAGGGDDGLFEAGWSLATRLNELSDAAIAAGSFTTAGGANHYILSAIKQ